MKIIQVLIIICFVSNVSIIFASKGYTLSLRVVDSYTHKAIGTYDIKIFNRNNEIIQTKNVINDTNLKINDLKEKNIKIITNSNKFSDNVAFSYIDNKEKNNIEHIVYLYPSDEYEHEILLFEDSLYGTTDYKDVLETDQIDASTPYNLMEYVMTNFDVDNINQTTEEKIEVQFIVETDGKVSHCRIVKGTNKIAINEIYRILRQTNWTPQHDQNNRKSRGTFRIPITIQSE